VKPKKEIKEKESSYCLVPEVCLLRFAVAIRGETIGRKKTWKNAPRGGEIMFRQLKNFDLRRSKSKINSKETRNSNQSTMRREIPTQNMIKKNDQRRRRSKIDQNLRLAGSHVEKNS